MTPRPSSHLNKSTFDTAHGQAEIVATNAKPVYFADVVAAIERDLGCRITLMPAADTEFAGQVMAVSRTLRIAAMEPVNSAFCMIDHMIFYDTALPSAGAARLIAHELFHISMCQNTDPRCHVDPETSEVHFDHSAEQEADIFSLCLLKLRPYRPGYSAPNTARAFIRLLNNEAGWPDWLTREETEEAVARLYSNG